MVHSQSFVPRSPHAVRRNRRQNNNLLKVLSGLNTTTCDTAVTFTVTKTLTFVWFSKITPPPKQHVLFGTLVKPHFVAEKGWCCGPVVKGASVPGIKELNTDGKRPKHWFHCFFLVAQISQVVPKHTWSGRHLLEMFHVCPLLFRQKMESPSGTSPSSDSPSARPVYRYIFSCPGEAQALVRELPIACRRCSFLLLYIFGLQSRKSKHTCSIPFIFEMTKLSSYTYVGVPATRHAYMHFPRGWSQRAGWGRVATLPASCWRIGVIRLSSLRCR